MLSYLRLRKGQLNSEYIFIALLIFLLILPVIYYGLQVSYENYRLLQTDNILVELGNAADDVDRLGIGNRKTVALEVPTGITGSVVKGNTLSITADTRKGSLPLARQTRTKLVGWFSVVRGQHFVPVKTIGQNLVRVGKGLALFSVAPLCVSPTGLPAQITLFGDEIDQTTVLLKDSIPYPLNITQFVNENTLLFTAITSEFTPKLNGDPYVLQLQKNTETSNSLLFYSYPASNFCGTPTPLMAAELHDSTHTFIEDIITRVQYDDGYFQALAPGQLIHLDFTDAMQQGDFLDISFFCTASTPVSLYKEGTSILLGSTTCIEDQWNIFRLHITVPTSPSTSFDLVASQPVDIDSISGYTT